ncbi:unnamed protein product [Lymnaea stagnalis]|uniref:TEPP protein n=1 Tax=Lymnaea stagnalis TaxID=6523 RepID=A0AAV2H4F7_LYMST
MTTVGVSTYVTHRADAPKIPDYAYKYNSFRRVQLAAVKQGIFHPNPPRFRRMEMDNAMRKMSDEHCRTTTTCGPKDFANATSSLFKPPTPRLPTLTITETGRQLHQLYSTPQDLERSKLIWSGSLNNSPAKVENQHADFRSTRDIKLNGYAVRYLQPDIHNSWRYTLRPEPKLDQYGQQPLPANIYARYRDTYPQQHRNVASEMWR